MSFQSLIVRDRCKLELWDHADDLDLGVPADLVSATLLHHPVDHNLHASRLLDRADGDTARCSSGN